MDKIMYFITTNIRTIGIVYVIVSAIVFIAVLFFFWWICKAEDEERELYGNDDYYYPEDEFDIYTGKTVTMIFGLISATICAVLWWAIPIVLIGLYIYERITRKFPELGGYTQEDDEENEEVFK